MKAYSEDWRGRVVTAVNQEMSRRELVSLFGVSEAAIKRYLKQRRETGSLAPKAIPGCPPRKTGMLQERLRPQLEAHPDATLEEHCRLWEGQTGVKVSTSTMRRAILRLRWTWKKKTLEASERKEEEREEWRKNMKDLDANKCRVIDETGSNIALTRLYGRAPRDSLITYLTSLGSPNWQNHLSTSPLFPTLNSGAHWLQQKFRC